MTDNTPNAGPVDAYTKLIPEHDCPGAECPHPAGFYMVGVKDADDPDEGAYLRLSDVHKINASVLITALVMFVDSSFQENREDETAMVAFARGRAMLRSLVDSINPPGEVLAEAGSFMDNINWDLS